MRVQYRLAAILAVSLVGVTGCPPDNTDVVNMRKLPEYLKLGVATSSFQIEGAWNVSDKSLSIWDTFCEVPGTIKDGSNGHDTCKSYEFYKRDIEMLKYLGVDFYRFSISWPRILPTGFTNKISKEGIAHYNRLIDELLQNGIEPVVTMYHWDLPQSLQDLGGWTNPMIAEWFEDYARVLFEAFGDRVKTWITLNEPKQFAIFGYGQERFAPNLVSAGIGDYMAVKNLLLAHARAWHLYNNVYRAAQKGVCGITIASDFRTGLTDSPEDVEAGNLALDFEIGLYSHPIFSAKGGYPERVIKRIAEKSAEQGYEKSRLPELSEEEIKYIRGTSDFYGFNHYSTQFFTFDAYKPGMYPIPSYNDDIGAVGTYGGYEVAPAPHTTKIPHGIRMSLNWIRESYNNPPILITENGYGTTERIFDDTDRITYYKEYINAILNSIEDGCNVVSYTAWSLMDNFEWASGFSQKFGLFDVDFNDEQRPRKAKLSALWYRDFVHKRMLDFDELPKMENVVF